MGKDHTLFPLTEEEIDEILKIIDEADFDELDLETGNFKLRVGKGKGYLVDMETKSVRLTPESPLEDQKTSSSFSSRASSHTDTGTAMSGTDLGVALEQDGLTAIKAPTLGIFYRSPKPGAPPFVDVGSLVVETDTVCLIEVMKLFNAVKAGVRGRVAKICAENTQMVEYHQTLFLVEPEPDSELSKP